MADDIARGGCLCGAVRFEIALPVAFCGHCHCSMCRKAHGAGFVTWIGVPRDRLRLLGPDAALTRYASSEHGARSFCRACGSSLFCTNDSHPDLVDVALGCVDDPIGLDPQLHFYFADRADWVKVADSLPRLDKGV